MSGNNRQSFNNDQRWRWADTIIEIMAILTTIEVHRRFIRTHASNADMHNVVLNLHQIIKEADGMATEISKIKQELAGFQDQLIQAIYEKPYGVLVQLRNANSADIDAAYLITESQHGRRCRRIRLSDYMLPGEGVREEVGLSPQ